MDKILKKTLLQIITHHRQNPLDYILYSLVLVGYFNYTRLNTEISYGRKYWFPPSPSNFPCQYHSTVLLLYMWDGNVPVSDTET
jgi:hypothetical protein